MNADRWAKQGSKLRKVFDCLRDGRWHSGSEIQRCYGVDGWAWDGCVAQLRGKIREAAIKAGIEGAGIESRELPGRHEHEYRMTLPEQAALKRRLEATERVVRAGRPGPPTSGSATRRARERTLF